MMLNYIIQPWEDQSALGLIYKYTNIILVIAMIAIILIEKLKNINAKKDLMYRYITLQSYLNILIFSTFYWYISIPAIALFDLYMSHKYTKLRVYIKNNIINNEFPKENEFNSYWDNQCHDQVFIKQVRKQKYIIFICFIFISIIEILFILIIAYINNWNYQMIYNP